MAAVNPFAPPNAEKPAAVPLATMRAYRKSGGAVVTVCRGRAIHRYRVTLRRYAALLESTVTRATRRWKMSAWWGRSPIAVSLWAYRYDP